MLLAWQPGMYNHMQMWYVMAKSDESELSVPGGRFLFALVVSVIEIYCNCVYCWAFINYYSILSFHLLLSSI